MISSRPVQAGVIEFLNLFNHPVVNNPGADPTTADLGTVTSQNNLPRDIQLAAGSCSEPPGAAPAAPPKLTEAVK